MTILGKIKKPEADDYTSRRKIYYVRNLYLPANATDKYKEIYRRYWREVEDHLGRLEKAGKVKKIFCESIYMTDEKSLKVLRAMNTKLERIVKNRIDAGAEFVPLEDKDLFGAYVDWNNCLMVVRTEAVHRTVHEFLVRAAGDRFRHVQSVLRENIADGEAGLLVMRDEDWKKLDLPEDIELFFVTPPAYDDLMSFIRDSRNETEYWRKTGSQD